LGRLHQLVLCPSLFCTLLQALSPARSLSFCYGYIGRLFRLHCFNGSFVEGRNPSLKEGSFLMSATPHQHRNLAHSSAQACEVRFSTNGRNEECCRKTRTIFTLWRGLDKRAQVLVKQGARSSHCVCLLSSLFSCIALPSSSIVSKNSNLPAVSAWKQRSQDACVDARKRCMIKE